MKEPISNPVRDALPLLNNLTLPKISMKMRINTQFVYHPHLYSLRFVYSFLYRNKSEGINILFPLFVELFTVE